MFHGLPVIHREQSRLTRSEGAQAIAESPSAPVPPTAAAATSYYSRRGGLRVTFRANPRKEPAVKTKNSATMLAFASALLIGGAARADDDAKKSEASKAAAVSINADEIKWGDAPPDLPKGAQLAVLHGDPSKKAPFTLRIKMPAGYKIPPHWHTRDEQLTILSGEFILHMGDTMDAPAHNLKPGGYHFLPGKMHHAAETKGETVLQLDGTGPFDIHYLNPADNPNPKPAGAKK
jgi:mannose-6-phosphate isomerase-like protein (cupin superfamily)